MQRSWALVLGGILVLAAGFGAGFLVADDGHGSDDDHGLRGDRMAVMMADGSMPEMMGDFVGMMDSMRASMTPEMRQQMDRDAMWKLMASGELAEMMQQHGRSMRGMPGMHAGRGGGHGHGGGQMLTDASRRE